MSLSGRQSKALEASIKHWERLAKCKTVEDFEKEGWEGRSCACCRMYSTLHGRCSGCPVRKKTGMAHCDDTPWHEADDAIGGFINGSALLPVDSIKKELNFLRSLRKL